MDEVTVSTGMWPCLTHRATWQEIRRRPLRH